MDHSNRLAAHGVRVLALLCLGIGLDEAAFLLGATGEMQSPVVTLGVTSFMAVATFLLAKIFAAVGLWIHSSWGAALLFGATLAELGYYLFGFSSHDIGGLSFILRLVLLLGSAAILGYARFKAMDVVHE